MTGRRNEIVIMTRMINLIKEKKIIHNYDLREKLNISKSQYNSIKPDLEHQFGWQVKYDKISKCWRYVGLPPTKEVEKEKEKERKKRALGEKK